MLSYRYLPLPTSWNWSFEGANTDSSALQNPTGICYLTEGTFTTLLSVENEFGTDNATIEITVGDAEVGNAEITEVGNTLVASPDGLNYQWYNCGGSLTEIIGATAQNFTPFANGLYAVIVSNNGCRDTSNCIGFAITAINELSLSDGISIYPIPFADGFYIDGALLGIKGNDIKLFNALGQIVFSKKLNGEKTFIKTENLATGIYFLEVQTVNTSRMYKLIKE